MTQPEAQLRVVTRSDNTVKVTIDGNEQQTSIVLKVEEAREAGTRLLMASLSGQEVRDEFQGVLERPVPLPSELARPEPEPDPESESTVEVPKTPEVASEGAAPLPADPEPVTVPPAYQGLLSDHTQTVWQVKRSARERALKIGVSEEQMLAAASHPERIDEMRDGAAVSHARDGVSALIPYRDPDAIIGVTWDEQTRKTQADTRRAASGGPGRKMPASYAELTDLLSAHGFVIEQGKNHPKVQHPGRPGSTVTIPRTTSDHRGYINMVATLRAEFGVDITLPPDGTP